jgi:predicted dehydrogenase
MNRRPLKLGVLGAGMIATYSYGVIPNLRHIPDKVQLVAVADPVVERAQDAQRQFGALGAYASLEEMLERCDLDVVANLTPIPVHGATSLAILQAGKHLVSEKPLATTMEEADALIETAAAQGLTIVCAPPNMVYPYYQEARRLIGEGTIGRVAFARVRSSNAGPASTWWPNDPTWFYQQGSGPLFDMGVYGIHEITGLLGPARRVVAFSGTTEPTRTVRGGPFQGKRIEVTADDNVLFMLDFGQATFAVIDGTFNVNASKGPKVEIFGRAGTININDRRAVQEGAPPLEVYRVDAVPGIGGWIVPESWALVRAQERVAQLQRAILVDHLVDCVWEQRQPVLSAEHARHALEIMLRVTESARLGQALDLTTSF